MKLKEIAFVGAVAGGALLAPLFIMWGMRGLLPGYVPPPPPEPMFSMEEIARHTTAENCWVVIDGLVFNVTPASKVHPAAFRCGGNSSENYHKNHGPVIRPQMMKLKIGTLAGEPQKSAAALTPEEKDTENATLSPKRTLLAKEANWNPLDLMLVVERDRGSFLAIDSSTHTPVARIEGVGYQPHTNVLSPDAAYTYLISRDGWLTKIDLKTFEPKKWARVGTNSRGTALTEDGKYLAVGNYEPGNVVLLDPATLEIIKTIELTAVIDGAIQRSRAGALVEKGSKIIIALKDLNSVWVVDTAQPALPVSEYYWNIGSKGGMLHDGFLTPDGKYFIVAAQDSKEVWALNADTMKEVARVPTGGKPHTGPGATWGSTAFVPSLDEGLITAIDMRTWKPIRRIATGGPGLFVRSYYKDPSYPYIWADTAFGDHSDEVYVIDGKKLEIVKTIISMPGKTSIHPEFTRDGKYVYVLVWGGDKIYVYDAYTLEEVTTMDATTPSVISNVGIRLEEPGI